MPLVFSNYSYGGVMGLASGHHSIDETTTKILRETGIFYVLSIVVCMLVWNGMGALIGRLLTLGPMRFQSHFITVNIYDSNLYYLRVLYGCRVDGLHHKELCGC